MKRNRTEEEIKQPKKMTSIGGQALMEGLMMIGPATLSMAVRLPDGTIHVETAPVGKSTRATKIPFIRGSVKIFQQMVIGTRYLLRSAQYIEDDIAVATSKKPPEESLSTGLEGSDLPAKPLAVVPEVLPVVLPENVEVLPESVEALTKPEASVQAPIETPAVGEIVGNDNKIQIVKKGKEKKPKGPGRIDRFLSKHSDAMLYVSAMVGILISVGLFILLPNLLTNLTVGLWLDKNASAGNNILFSLTEGIVRIAIFIAYLALASSLKDIKRVWMYHGAEHKTIFCYESGLPLTIDNVRTFSKHHPRCGTAFMFIILILSIIVFSFVPGINIIVDMLIRLACVPILAGLAYEVIHWSARHDNFATRILTMPGLWLQRLTTKEPDDQMIEVAIAAMVPVIPAGERGDEW